VSPGKRPLGRGDRCAWLLGLSLNAAGRYGHALEVLMPLLTSGEQAGAPPEVRVRRARRGDAGQRAPAARHARGRADRRPTRPGADRRNRRTRFACHLGLAADSVGLGDGQTAHSEVDIAATLLPDRPTEWWRQRVHYDWVRNRDRPARRGPGRRRGRS
jgi:hypothetical protein